MIYANESTYDALINQAAAKYGISAVLLKSVVAIESAFNPRAVSGAKALGIAQMLLPTARWLGYTGAPDGLFDPAVALPLSAKYLRILSDRYKNNLAAVLSGYNAGHSMIPVTGPENIRNEENREYVRRGLIHLQYYAGKLDAAGARVMLKNKSWIKTGAIVGLSTGALLLLVGVGLLVFRWTR